MCGRFTLTAPARLARAFPRYRFGEFSQTRLPRYNVAPSQAVLGVRNDGERRAEPLLWGLHGRINARSEGLAARRSPIARRCAVFADGFFEWRGSTPVRFALRSGEPFALAGVWEATCEGPACLLLTCPPNELVRSVHDRMPVLVTPAELDLWLDPAPLPAEVAAALLRPYDPSAMTAADASPRLNDPRYDEAAGLDPAGAGQLSLGL